MTAKATKRPLAKVPITNLPKETNDLKGKTDHPPTNFLVIKRKGQKDSANLLLTSLRQNGDKIRKGVKGLPPAAMAGDGAKEALQKINLHLINLVQKKGKDQHLTADHPIKNMKVRGL